MALAQAIIEFVHDHIGAKTLFSTHYHELTVLESQLSELKNVHVRAEEHEGTVVFLHQIKEGAADKSYGIHVAQLAELPDAIINRAQTILTELESGSHDVTPTVSAAPKAEKTGEKQQLFFEVEEKPQPKAALKQKDQAVIDELKSYNLMDMTPLEAMTKLYELQKKL